MIEGRQIGAVKDTQSARCELSFSGPTEDTLLVRLAGNWRIGEELPPASEVQKEIESGPRVKRIAFDTKELGEWDSGLLTFLIKVIKQCSRSKIDVEKEGLPHGVGKLLALASAVPEKKGTGKESLREPFLSRVGEQAINAGRSVGEMLAFIGEAFVAFIKFLGGRARYRRSD